MGSSGGQGGGCLRSSPSKSPGSAVCTPVSPGPPSPRSMEIITNSASICFPVTVYFQGLGSLPSSVQLAPGSQNRLETPRKGNYGINAATALFARYLHSILLPYLLPASSVSPGSCSEQALCCVVPRTTAALLKWLLSAAIISLNNNK